MGELNIAQTSDFGQTPETHLLEYTQYPILDCVNEIVVDAGDLRHEVLGHSSLLFIGSCIITRGYWKLRGGVLEDVALVGIGGGRGGADCKI